MAMTEAGPDPSVMIVVSSTTKTRPSDRHGEMWSARGLNGSNEMGHWEPGGN